MVRRTLSYRGFTLIELMAVIAVTGILAVVAAPLWRSPGGVDMATNRFTHDLKGARALAIARRETVLLPLTGATSYVGPTGERVDLAPSGGAVTADGVIGFNGRGEPTGATSITITGPDGTRIVTILPTGWVAP